MAGLGVSDVSPFLQVRSTSWFPYNRKEIIPISNEKLETIIHNLKKTCTLYIVFSPNTKYIISLKRILYCFFLVVELSTSGSNP